MPTIVDKSLVTKVCVDDFALRKRYSYGTVMVDLDTHRIIDIIDSRETTKVADWLKTYPNLKVISRDGAQTYASASTNSHPNALQVSDRFHLLKNLSEVVEKYMRYLFPSRLVIPATKAIQSPEMLALYNTRNRGERIRYAQQKRTEGYTINDIALLLHSSERTISKYLVIPEDEIPEPNENAREIQHINQMNKKQMAINEVRKLYAQGHAIDAITRLTGHTSGTIQNYLKEDCSTNNGHYDCRRPGKLSLYEHDVISMRAQGITYPKIHESICSKGYTGTVASLRVFMQKERTHQKAVSQKNSSTTEYIPRKFMCQLIYREIENIKGLTQEQYDTAVQKYPILGQLYTLLKEFHRIMFSQKGDELEQWISSALSLKINELDTYISGLKKDLEAVKNGINYKYNNGLAEGSVNKIKLIKRIMYGRNSFQLLKAKILLNEYYYQIN
jgi:transposase